MDHPAPGGGESLPPLWRRWAAFLFGVLLISVFMFGVLPWLERLPMVKPLVDFIEESGINVQGLFYTEVEEAGLSEVYLRDAMRYSPGKR
ncbi:MAG: hypothetical protein V3S64_09240 [bacterium]